MQGTMSYGKKGDRRILILAGILGAIAAGLAVAYLVSLDRGTPSVSAATATGAVVVAREDIAPGTRITAEMVEVRELPLEAVVSGASRDVDLVVGETARYPLAEGEQISATRLVAPVEVQALSFQIPEGMRGFTIPVSTEQSPAALLAPGDFVDVLVAASLEDLVTEFSVQAGPSVLVHSGALGGELTIEGLAAALATAAQEAGAQLPAEATLQDIATALAAASDGDGDQAAAEGEGSEFEAVTTLLQNVQVLSVQRDYVANGVPYDASVRGVPPEQDGISYVTLSLTPEQSQLLWLASQKGEITFTLRAFGDEGVAEVGAVPPITTEHEGEN